MAPLLSIAVFLVSGLLSLVHCESAQESVQTCFTPDKRPAVCVEPEHCKHFHFKSEADSKGSCTESGRVCCPYGNELENREAFHVPRWNLTDITDWINWPEFNWTAWASARPTFPTIMPTSTANPNTMKPGEGPPQTKCGARQNINLMQEEEPAPVVVNASGFIVGGTEAKAHTWPWMVALYKGSQFSCGGAVISDRYVLCAAHCVSSRGRITKPDQIRLLIGAHDRRSSGQWFNVEKVIVHSTYSETKMQDDISMFKLTKPIQFSKNVMPLCIPPAKSGMCEFEKDKMAYLAGWGTTSAGGSVSQTLQEVQVPFISTAECQKAYNQNPGMITNKQICAGMLGKGGKDTCQGDSGGPLAVRPDSKANMFYQCGIVSWGRGCADRNYPGVYTKVSEHNSWIEQNMK